MRRIFVAILGFIVLLVGLIMIVLPGPAFVIIPLGLGILATEFLWARRLLKKLRTKFKMFKKVGLYSKKISEPEDEYLARMEYEKRDK